MEFSATQIADILGGEIEGNPDQKVASLSKIQDGEPGTLTFLANPKYNDFIYDTKASLAIVNKSFEAESKLPETLTLIRVPDAYASFAKLLEIYQEYQKPLPGIDPSASVHESAKIGADTYIGPAATIGPNAVIGDKCIVQRGVQIGSNCKIGINTCLHSGVQVLHSCLIGNSCVIHAGAVIGSDGFGFAPNRENQYNKVPQIGNVIIEDHVEIGANTCIDRATLGSTIIRKGVKLDNLIQIAHNVDIGENTVIAAQTGIAGSTTIGKDCMIGGQVGLVGHIQIADGVKIAAQSGLQSSITEPGSIVQGSPAFSIGDYKKSYVGFRKLPQLMAEIHALKKRLTELENPSQES